PWRPHAPHGGGTRPSSSLAGEGGRRRRRPPGNRVSSGGRWPCGRPRRSRAQPVPRHRNGRRPRHSGNTMKPEVEAGASSPVTPHPPPEPNGNVAVETTVESGYAAQVDIEPGSESAEARDPS